MADETSETGTPKTSPSGALEFEVLSSVIQSLQRLTRDGRMRVLSAVGAFLEVSTPVRNTLSLGDILATSPVVPSSRQSQFSEDRTPSPKEFLFEKRPQTDVERVTCLAYYLTHYRETPHFKTLDLSKLNTEAAQVKFSNAAVAVDNATRSGMLAAASRGLKQISAGGELYVQALPDRTAAKEAVSHARPKRKSRKVKSNQTAQRGRQA